MTRQLTLLLLGAWMLPFAAFAQNDPLSEGVFPTAPIIEGQKAFWIRVFAETSSKEGLFHDSEFTQPVYEKLDLRGLNSRTHRQIIRARRVAISDRLKELSARMKSGEPLNPEQQRLLDRFPAGTSAERIYRAAGNVRFQRGLADRFKNGLAESGAYLQRMQEILESHGVPRTLAYLPHVESSFKIRSYSRAGAAGIWQFIRTTGKEFMRVGYEVDERLDPILATEAAAKLLAENYRALGSWPLAITAYNHGRQSLRRIIKLTGSDDLAYLIENFSGYRFKFASKNFYAEFLAARDVVQNYQEHFGEVEFREPLQFQQVRMPFYMDFAGAARILGIGQERLAELNPSLRPPVQQGTKYIPRDYLLRLPPTMLPDAFLDLVPKSARYSQQKRTAEVVVLRGDTLYDIGRRVGVPWRQIARANNISVHRHIRPGQRLLIPGRAAPIPVVAVSSPSSASEPVRGPAEPDQPQKAESGTRGPVEPVVVAAESTENVVEPASSIPPTDSTELPESVGTSLADGAMLFQNLELHGNDPALQQAEIITTYGETLGHYANWAQVSTNAVRRINDLGYGRLRPGKRIIVPLDRIAGPEFLRQRHEYHRSREEDFFAFYAVLELTEVRVRSGDSPWSIAQSKGVPMWLFYQHNPKLIGGVIRVGDTVLLPVIEEIQNIRNPTAPVRLRQAG